MKNCPVGATTSSKFKINKKLKENVLLKNHTTFRIGGPARYFFLAENRQEVIRALTWAKKSKLAFFILGGGSNVLASDEGYKGIVIKYQISPLKSQNYTSNVKSNLKRKDSRCPGSQPIYAEGGVLLSKIVSLAAKHGLAGLEWAVGIPGTLGGAIHGNAAAFGRSISEIIWEVEVFDVQTEKTFQLPKKACFFGYRTSIFKKNPNLIILGAQLKLSEGNLGKIQNKMKSYLDYRLKHHPLNFPSAGSIFKNLKFTPLEISKKFPTELNPKLLKEFPELKEFRQKEEIPAGFLIDKAGLKGKSYKRAQISEKHANFIINLGGARAKDVLALIRIIKKKVKAKFGVCLEEEISFLGF